MSEFASQAHVMEYTTRTEHLLQQRGSKLLPYVTQHSFMGKNAQVVQQFGAIEVQEIVNRHADTVLTSTPQTSRWLRPSDWGSADMVDKEDLIRSLTDPKSDLSMAQAMALGRKQDDVIINGLLGSNFTGEDGATTVTASTDGVGVDSTAGIMSLAKLRIVREAFMAAEVDLDRDQIILAMTSAQFDQLLGETNAISIDYQNEKPLASGQFRSLLGFHFVHCERLPLNSGGTRHRCIAWVKSGAHFGTWNSLETNVDKRPDKWNNFQVMTKGSFGACRTEGSKVYEVLADI